MQILYCVNRQHIQANAIFFLELREAEKLRSRTVQLNWTTLNWDLGRKTPLLPRIFFLIFFLSAVCCDFGMEKYEMRRSKILPHFCGRNYFSSRFHSLVRLVFFLLFLQLPRHFSCNCMIFSSGKITCTFSQTLSSRCLYNSPSSWCLVIYSPSGLRTNTYNLESH